MKLSDIKVVGGPLARASEADVLHLEEHLGTRFPSGYREFMTTFGEGALGPWSVRVYPPWRILNDTEQTAWRERVSEYWNWAAGAHVLSKTKAMECILLGDRLEGGEFLFHRTDPERIYVLPQDSDDIHVTGPGLLATLDFLSTTSDPDTPSEAFDFVPSDSRPQLPYEDARDLLAAALTRDASLQSASRVSELGDGYDDLCERVPRGCGSRCDRLKLALNFWGAWLDAAEHDWLFDEPFLEYEWPVLAQRIAEDLSANREIEDARLRRHFAPWT